METKKNHPKGLYLLFVTEMWERFSYYGMRAIFILYLIQALKYDKALSSQIYGNIAGLVYLTPLIGGYISDRYWGNRRSILWGAIIMAIGQFMMFGSALYFDNISLARPLMYAALTIQIVGSGLFKPNIVTMVGDLYSPTDTRKDSAYTIFYMGINVGAMIAPVWCGFVGDTGNPSDFKWGFLSAGVGMLISAVVFYVFKNRYLVTPSGDAIGMPPAKVDTPSTKSKSVTPASLTKIVIGIVSFVALTLLFSINWGTEGSIFEGADLIGAMIYSSAIVMPIYIFTDSSLNAMERGRILVIFIIAFFVIFFWAAFEQAGASLTFFAQEQTDRVIFGWEMPASYFQMFNAVFILLLAPIFAWIWAKMGSRGVEPSSPLKQSMGLWLLAIGYLIIALGVKGVGADTKVSMLWLVGLYLSHTMGELCLSPIGLSMVNKLSPARFSSLLMSVWFLSLSVANQLSGVLSGFYPEAGVSKSFMGFDINTVSDFFMLFVVMSGVAALILFALSGYLKRMMQGVE